MTDLSLAFVLVLCFVALPALRWANVPQLIINGLAIVTVAIAIAFSFGRFHIPVPPRYAQLVKIVTVLLMLFGAAGNLIRIAREKRNQRVEGIARSRR